MVKKWIIMFVLSALLVCLSECLTGEKKPAAEITQIGAASELSDQSQGETVTLSELSDKSQGETAVLSELSGKSGEDTDVPQEDWKKAYEEKLNNLYEWKKDERWYSYTVRDLDGNGVPELILRSPGKTTGSKITVYSYEQGIKKIGKHHFIGGTTVLLVTDHPSYPGIIYFQVGGGLEYYSYLGTEECYCSSEDPEQPYYLPDKKTALLERIQQQLTEEFLSRDEGENPWKQYEVYISDFDVNAWYTVAIFIIDQKKVEVCRCLTWNVMLDNGKTSDQIALSKFDPGSMKDWTDPKVREDYQEMLDASICHFVIER